MVQNVCEVGDDNHNNVIFFVVVKTMCSAGPTECSEAGEKHPPVLRHEPVLTTT